MEQLLGCRMTAHEATFCIYAQQTFGMIFEVYQTAESTTPIYKQMLTKCDNDGFYSITLSGIEEGMYYVWRMLGEDYSYSPAIMDPYAKGTYYVYGEWRNLVVADSHFTTAKPNIPWDSTIIYELHVGHFTHSDPDCPEEERGTFKGLIRKLPYLKALGVTTLELLPIFKWYPYTLKSVSPLTGKCLEDVWGYNTLAFFAVDERYSVDKTCKGALIEFKQFVEAAHREQIEVLLDVVYNHSGEGGSDGVAIHFKRLAPKTYYKFHENGEYLNCSGTGNTLNTNHPIVKRLIKDSLCYWSQEVGVDGFRFDLASILGQDEKGRWLKESLLNEIGMHPGLSKVKLITESWDAKGSYDVGRMPAPFCEWSDYFRDTMRKFVKGDQGIVQAVVDCLKGKEVYFTDSQKGKGCYTIHFITAHDGFTMRDLVSYNGKHNEANGENNRDGHNANYSYNWGVEGETDNPEILAMRDRAVKNLYGLLLLSKGIPMLRMGDEIGRTQKGNNNAFCQDNELVWVDWKGVEQNKELLAFVKGMINLRKKLDYFHQEDYHVSWHGVHYDQPDLSYYSRSIACYMEGKESLFLIINSYCEPLSFELPPITSGKWHQIVNTASKIPLADEIVTELPFCAQAYSISLFKQEEA